ncbi:AlpA family transcriptional regulator [Methylophilus sp. OH31]|uniref:helix-turn-helix transcriptional regulator n=1 Tax=Methylophilus sp. OH31 TaxID=1387312 RepID=UPI000465815E|nr:AlpA family transcriptional regulator [Methylophilus sp. OH31]
MSDVILKLPAVQAITGLGRSTIYDRISKGEFPRPVPLGTHSVGWLSSEVDGWIKSRISQRKAA